MLRFFACLLCATALPGGAIAGERTLIAQVGPDSRPPEAESPAARPKPAQGTRNANQKADLVMLDEAIDRALSTSPRLKASIAAVAASRGERRQAGALPNPELSYSKENFRAGPAYKAISPGQNVYGVTQLIEVGGKVAARKDVAERGVEIAGLDSQAVALDLIRDVTVAYADAVATEESVRLAAEQKALADDVLKSVSVRVEAAASPLIQQSRAEVERSSALVALEGAKRERTIARKTLATLLGSGDTSFKLDKKPFFSIAKPKTRADAERLKNNPDLLKLSTSLEQSRARLDLERANAVPDPRLSAGLIEIGSVRDKALVVGVSLPIPVFNANRGNIERAQAEVARTEQENRSVALSLGADLTRAEQQMESAYAQAHALEAQILPSAQRAFSLAREGYVMGRFAYLEVLDAQRALFGVKQQRIAALRAYHAARADLDRLVAYHGDKLGTDPSGPGSDVDD